MSDKKEFKIIRNSYYGTQVSIPIEELNKEQLIKLCQYQSELIDDYKNQDKHEKLRDKVFDLEKREHMYGYQVDKIIGVMAGYSRELGSYNDPSLYGNGKSPVNGVCQLVTKLRYAERRLQTLKSASADDTFPPPAKSTVVSK